MIRLYKVFLEKVAANIRRIVRATKYDVTEDDLKQDALIIAYEIGEKRGREIDFSNPSDQDEIMRRLNFRNVKRGDWNLRNGLRIDEQKQNEDGEFSWMDRLAAPEHSDPLIALLALESSQKLEARLINNYSQVVAYLRAFANLKNSPKEICAHLAITNGTLNRRVGSAIAVFKVQPSLFDGIERIGRDFIPLRGAFYAVKMQQQPSGYQRYWDF